MTTWAHPIRVRAAATHGRCCNSTGLPSSITRSVVLPLAPNCSNCR
jgi:hypothetical protein